MQIEPISSLQSRIYNPTESSIPRNISRLIERIQRSRCWRSRRLVDLLLNLHRSFVRGPSLPTPRISIYPSRRGDWKLWQRQSLLSNSLSNDLMSKIMKGGHLDLAESFGHRGIRLSTVPFNLDHLLKQVCIFSKIADHLGVSKPTQIKWSGELQSQISAARYAQLEALAEEYGLLKEARVKAFGQLLEKLTTELSKRELSEVPTFQLLKMVLDVSSKVREEVCSVTHSEGGMADLNLFGPTTLRID